MKRWRVIGRVVVYGGIALAIATGVPPVTIDGTEVWREAVPADSVPHSIAEAELQGSRHPRAPEPAAFGEWWTTETTVGTPDRRCVVVGDANRARSGDLIGGPFRLYAAADYSRRGGGPKLSFATAHEPPIGERIQLIVKAVRIDAPAERFVFTGRPYTVRWSALVMWRLTDSQWWTGATLVTPPSPGRWLFVTSVGVDWGCFVLDLPPITEP